MTFSFVLCLAVTGLCAGFVKALCDTVAEVAGRWWSFPGFLTVLMAFILVAGPVVQGSLFNALLAVAIYIVVASAARAIGIRAIHYVKRDEKLSLSANWLNRKK